MVTILTLLLLLLLLASSINSNHIPAIYIFGDSLVDSGNNNYLPIPSDAKFLPYGIDFGSGKPTGRCTNGKTVVDYLAIHLGLPFVPPYLGLTEAKRNKIITGINFASAGSGILPETNNKTLTLDMQIKLFKRVIQNNLAKIFNEKEKLEKHISESLFIVSSGVNDHFLSRGNFRGSRKFEFHLLREFFLHLQKIYFLGGRKFFVNNLPPAGCFPSKSARLRGKCNETINKEISLYNNNLLNVLKTMQSQFPGFMFIHSDLYEHLMELRENGHKYGILETSKPCCPYNISGDLKCNRYSDVCPNRNTHLFFDDHPSQIANKIYARHCFIQKKICKSSGIKL
ncbi:hypothetical protein P8452_07697 [Trifolium repens]|nr:hypothetical protein P8452_07697 [Trifolium repens]